MAARVDPLAPSAAESRRSRRLPRPVRVPESLLALAAFGLALCLFYAGVLFQQRTLLPLAAVPGVPALRAATNGFSDAYRVDRAASVWQLTPWAREVARAYAEGRLPLWNAHQGFGAPFAANAQSGAFDLLRLPVFLHPSAETWDAYYLARVLLGLAATYLFARRVGLGPTARIVAALAYVFSGFMLMQGNTLKTEIYFLLPLLLWAIERVLGGHWRGGLAAVAILVALATLAGHPEATFLTFAYAASYAAWRLVGRARAAGAWRATAAPAGLLALGWGVGLGLAAPMTLPLAEYLGQAFTTHSPERALGLRAWPPEHLAWLGMPHLPGLPSDDALHGNWAGVWDYCGTAVLLLAVLGLPWRGRATPRGVERFALGAALLVGAKLFGVPGVNELGRLPLFDIVHLQKYGAPLLTFSLALLAGVGAQRVDGGQARGRAALVVLGAFAAYLALALWLAQPLLAQLPAAHVVRNLGLAALVAGLLAGLVALPRRLPGAPRDLPRGPRLPSALAGAGCCALVAGELF